jgi:transcriptional regulator with XRE-family HTH domain
MIERFKSLLLQLHLSASEFADRIGVQRSSVSHILSGRNKPSIDFLEKILNVFPDIDTTWLITGRARTEGAIKQLDTEGLKKQSQLQFPGLEQAENEQPAPAEQEPVDHIIIVYKNDTFRILKPSGK